LFDTHCHLTDIEDPDAALAAAQAAGVGSLLTCGYHGESNQAVCELRQRHPGLPIALGLHPWFADEPVAPVLRVIERQRPVAVGEAGLDLWADPPPAARERQLEVLEAQLELATRLALPVTLHSRKAVAELLGVLRNHPEVRGALHAFSGSYEQARSFVDLGYFIGVGGAVTRGRAKRVRRCAAALPLDAILLETDAPAIGLDGVEPPHVRPAHLPRVAAALAELRGEHVEQIEQQTDANAIRLYGPRAAMALSKEQRA
jgi:TatD DNase family protein